MSDLSFVFGNIDVRVIPNVDGCPASSIHGKVWVRKPCLSESKITSVYVSSR